MGVILGPKNRVGPPGKDGINGLDGANGINGRDGIDGAQGRDGRDGVDGRDGKPGARWLTGKGRPPEVLGRLGDMYLDVLLGDVWEKKSLGWVKVGNIQGPPGANGTAGIGDDDDDWETRSTTIEAGETKIIESVPSVDFQLARYTFAIYNRAASLNRTFDLSVTNVFSDVRDQLFNRHGTALNLLVSTALVTGNMRLTFTNNEAVALTINYARLIR